jgi:very-short-patch-repair endonuclease
LKRKTTNEFIEDAIKIHGNKYDYSLVDYINSYTKIKIICKKHGVFEQQPNSHLNGQNCLKCVNENQTKSREQFIIDSNKIHGNKYDYSLTEYINNESKVKIICVKHGIFEQKPTNHLSGNGCPMCKIDKKRLNIDYILKRCNDKFNNKYKYDLTNYKNNNQKIKITCPIHGEFEQRIKNHFKLNGCPFCSKKRMNTKFFKQECSLIHNNKYDYSLVEYKGAFKKVKIICPNHGVFEQVSSTHLFGSGCPKCKSSKGEIKIFKFLDKNKIKYDYQKIFNDCVLKTYLPFDFYLPEHNICIEYDGEQHFKSVDYFGGDGGFEIRKTNDEIKNKYCKDNNIKLIRISYIDIKDVEKILNKELNYD